MKTVTMVRCNYVGSRVEAAIAPPPLAREVHVLVRSASGEMASKRILSPVCRDWFCVFLLFAVLLRSLFLCVCVCHVLFLCSMSCPFLCRLSVSKTPETAEELSPSVVHLLQNSISQSADRREIALHCAHKLPIGWSFRLIRRRLFCVPSVGCCLDMSMSTFI